MPLETRNDDRKDFLSNGHLEWVVVPGTLERQGTHKINILFLYDAPLATYHLFGEEHILIPKSNLLIYMHV